MGKYIHLERIERVGHIEFRRADKLNAMNDDFVRELRDVIYECDADDKIWVTVFSGAGKAFSSGADVRERQLRDPEEVRYFGGPAGRGAKGKDLLQDLNHWKPAIAAVHGYCMGMALGFAMECELIVADRETKFQVTEVPRGLPGARYNNLLRFRGGGAFADEVTVTGRFFTAEEAQRGNLVNRVTEPGQAVANALAWAKEISDLPPLGTRTVARMRRHWIKKLTDEALLYVDPLKLHLSNDFKESAKAFTERRPHAPYTAT